MGIVDWFTSLAANSSVLGKALTVFFVSILPIVELRGAIPVGVALGLPNWLTFVLAYFGNMLPVPFIILFIKKIFSWMKQKSPRLRRFAEKMEAKAEKKSKQVTRYKKWGLMIFVAIPLPGTGAWTGSLIAAMLDMKLKDALPVIALGVLIAGVLMTGISLGFSFFLSM